jgi:hypothetical protein
MFTVVPFQLADGTREHEVFVERHVVIDRKRDIIFIFLEMFLIFDAARAGHVGTEHAGCEGHLRKK